MVTDATRSAAMAGNPSLQRVAALRYALTSVHDQRAIAPTTSKYSQST
jgi:hypothetical protein